MKKIKLFAMMVLLFGALFSLSGCTKNFCVDGEQQQIKDALQVEILADNPTWAADTTTYAKEISDAVEAAYRTHPQACITIVEKEDPVTGVLIEPKDWAYAMAQGPLEVVFVYPIALLMIYIVEFFAFLGSTGGLPQILAIILSTLIVRLVTLPLTAKSTAQTTKLQQLSPELSEIQAKYGNSKDPADKQKQSVEMMKLYEKHGINPLSAMISPFFTLPIFVAVWGAVRETMVLREGVLFNLGLGDPLSSGFPDLVNPLTWNWFAVILVIAMIGSQYVTMKMPQWQNKKKLEHMDPRARASQNTQNMTTNIFLVMIVFIGWSLPVAMTVYWITSSLITLGQNMLIRRQPPKEAK